MAQTVYEVITQTITAKLESGVCPWRMPWTKMGAAPRNIKGRAYSGSNFFLLSMMGFSDPTFLTFNQAKALGGTVKKGEKGVPIIFWKMMEKVEDGVKKNIPMLRYFTVFNVSQTEGVKYEAPTVPSKPEFHIEAAEKIAAGYINGPKVSFGGDRACYRPATDDVTVPNKAQFDNEGEFYSTLFHELGHSTGHKSRLDRKELGADGFGSELYSTEELTAELTAAFLCADAGIDTSTIDNSAAYIGGWLKKLKQDPKAFITAAGKAQKAANLINPKVEAAQEEEADQAA